MGHSSSHHVIHHHRTVVTGPTPAEIAEKKRLDAEKVRLEEERKKAKEASLREAIEKQIQQVLDSLQKLSLSQAIPRADKEKHIGFFGPVSSGKTTFQTVLYGLSNPVALGHCTEGANVVSKNRERVIWDVHGEDQSFSYFAPEELSFAKSLNVRVILFDSDIESITWILKIMHAINPTNLLIVRTKADQCGEDSSRSVAEEKARDGQKVKEVLGLAEPWPVYCISSHNVRDGKEKFDWDTLVTQLK